MCRFKGCSETPPIGEHGRRLWYCPDCYIAHRLVPRATKMEAHLAVVERRRESVKRFEEEVENGTRKVCKLEGCLEIIPLGTTQYHDDKKI